MAAAQTQSLHSELKKVWSGSGKVLYRDLPRLAKRITIQTNNGVVLNRGVLQDVSESAEGKAPASDTNLSTWVAVSNVVLTVASHFEIPEQLAVLKAHAEELSAQASDDLPALTEDLLSKTSPGTLAVFKVWLFMQHEDCQD